MNCQLVRAGTLEARKDTAKVHDLDVVSPQNGSALKRRYLKRVRAAANFSFENILNVGFFLARSYSFSSVWCLQNAFEVVEEVS